MYVTTMYVATYLYMLLEMMLVVVELPQLPLLLLLKLHVHCT